MNTQDLSLYWSRPIHQLMESLDTSPDGLPEALCQERQLALQKFQLNPLKTDSVLRHIWNQIRNPLVFLLLIAAMISGILAEWTDALIIAAIVVLSSSLGFWREYSSTQALEKLTARLKLTTTVLRGGQRQHVANQSLVPGDIIFVTPGKVVPADCIVLDADNLFINQAAMTGESFAVAKFIITEGMSPSTPLAERDNCLFMGSNVYSGMGRALIVNIGTLTEYGKLSKQLSHRSPETEFDKGIREFGNLLLRIMLVMVLIVFGAHAVQGQANFQALMFAMALAVGLSPELLPAILSVNLASSAQRMARAGVLVRRLNAIENLGSITVLCSDKTGTLTEGVIRLHGAFDSNGQASSKVLWAAGVNAKLQTGLANPLDDALLQSYDPPLDGVTKLAEVPYDFVRKKLSIIIGTLGETQMICKGAFDQVIKVCTGTTRQFDTDTRLKLQVLFDTWSQQGFRVLAVASGPVIAKANYTSDDERDLQFLGFLVFADRPKAGMDQTVSSLKELGVGIKIITGDNAAVSKHVAESIGIQNPAVLTSSELNLLSDEALWNRVSKVDIFAHVDPSQKARIILALKHTGHVVGYMGDGINDIAAMHAADASISVESAVDIAKVTADFVFIEKNLDIVRQGIVEGRQTFANTMKYVLMTTSANLGNMLSMALATFIIPFLPLTAGQILLNNFLSDIPTMGLARDAVDPELVTNPRRWDARFIQNFMLSFGLLSTVFDILTFWLLLAAFHLNAEEFRTGWFVESLLTELCVLFVLRTQRSFYRSRPNFFLIMSSIVVAALAFIIPYAPFARSLGFVPLPGRVLICILALTIAYTLATEFAKSTFFSWSRNKT